ncbi:TPA: hypothetical protein DEA21_04775 [Candidatus Uhrbacteria bacterium]|nr:hypothetical protein [Candidatus Uhrbacteria bacterium]
MGKLIEIRRHSIKDGLAHGTLGPKGFTLARTVGERQLHGSDFTGFYASRLWRTYQSLVGFGEGAGDFRWYNVPPQAEIYLNWPELIDLWRACHRASTRGEDMLQAAFAHNSELSLKTATEGAKKFLGWTEQLLPDARVLVVGHSPYSELIVYGLTGKNIPALKECQGFRILINDDDRLEVDWQSPDLDPTNIRRQIFSEPPM